MKRSGNSKIKLLAATSMVIFSLAAAFSGAYAWFDSNSKVAQEADTMKVEVVRNFKSITIYPVLNATVSGYSFSTTPVEVITFNGTNGNSSFEYKDSEGNFLKTEDQAIVNMNPKITVGQEEVADPYSPLRPYHPLLFVIEYQTAFDASDSDTPCYIRAQTDAHFLAKNFDAANRNIELSTQAIQATGNPLSAFIHTYGKSYGENDPIPFEYTAEELGELLEGHFVSVEKVNNKDTAFYTQTPILFADSSNTAIKKVALIFDYNPAVIEYIYNENLGLRVLDSQITAMCDWTLII